MIKISKIQSPLVFSFDFLHFCEKVHGSKEFSCGNSKPYES